MRSFSIVLVLLAFAASPALAERLVVMSEPHRAQELGPALEVALAGRRVAVTSWASPAGTLRLDRAAAAQRAAVELQADAAIWIDHEIGKPEVCAVSADGRYFRHAPLPGSDSSPRVFAAIAASLVDELLAPPEAPLDVNVDVHVNVGAVDSPGHDIDDAPSSAPGTRASIVTRDGPMPWERGSLEAGITVGTFALALEGSLLMPVSPHWRAGVSLLFGMPFVNSVAFSADTAGGDPVAAATAEVRHTGHGYRHKVIGGFAGAMTALGDGVFVTGMRFGYTWEGKYVSTQIALSPTLIVADHGYKFYPAAWLSMRMGFRL